MCCVHVRQVSNISHDKLTLPISQNLAAGSWPSNSCCLRFHPTHSDWPVSSTRPPGTPGPETFASSYLVLLGSAVLASENTDPLYPGTFPPLLWDFLACSLLQKCLFIYTCPRQGDSQFELKESTGVSSTNRNLRIPGGPGNHNSHWNGATSQWREDTYLGLKHLVDGCLLDKTSERLSKCLSFCPDVL